MVGAGRRSLFEVERQTVGVLVRPNAMRISVGPSEVNTFDPSGRLHAAFDRGHHFRRRFDGRVLETWRVRQGQQVCLRERWLGEDESSALVEQTHARVLRLLEAGKQNADVRGAMARIALWTKAAYAAHRAQFHAIYRPVTILPPDQYLAVVVQATEGCSWNQCTFCDFFQDRHFRIRSREELDRHIADVRSFMGEGLAMRRSIFLGDANVLALPWQSLPPMFDATRAGFPDGGFGPSWRDVFAFVDVWGGRRRTVDELIELKAMGLRRVYLGLETGHDGLLARVNKRGSGALAVDVVNRFKAAGIQVGVIVLLGLGGTAYADDHVWDTVRVLNKMHLGEGDLVYFSELMTSSHLPYARDMWAANIRALTSEQMAEQQARIEQELAFSGPDGPKLARYDIRRFAY